MVTCIIFMILLHYLEFHLHVIIGKHLIEIGCVIMVRSHPAFISHYMFLLVISALLTIG